MKQSVDQSLRRAASLSARGNIAEAEAIYRTVLERFPTNRRALDGISALAGGSDAKAYDKGLNAIFELYDQGRLHEAADHLRMMIELYPSQPDLRNLDGAVHAGLGEYDRAIEAYDRALALRPDNAEVHANRASALIGLKRFAEALASCDAALSLDRDKAQAHSNRGIALKQLGRPAEALAAYELALRFKPQAAEIHYNRGNALLDLKQLDDAVAAYDRALALRPSYAFALANRGHALRDLERLDAAIDSYSRALALKPDYQEPLAQLIYQRARMCDWQDDVDLTGIGLAGEAISPYAFVVLDDDPPRNLLRARKYVGEMFPDAAPCPPDAPKHQGPIRIGYFSADFHDHAVMYQLARMFELHDRSRFSVHAFSYGEPRLSPMRTRLEQAFDVFHEVSAMDSNAIATLARREAIDIAIDLMGYTTNGRPDILALRPAPVQISYIGYPGTMGAPFVDYLIADPVLIPEAWRDDYAEKIIALPEIYQANDDTRAIADRVMTRAELGLPEQNFVFCCFNNSFKIGRAEFDIWMRLLGRIDGSVLWLFQSNRWVEENLRSEAAKRGIDPARLVFAGRMPHGEHLARLRQADLFLDCFACNAHATASDALWAGVPVLTTPGRSFTARVGASVARAVGLPELIAASRDDYERMALDLATDPAKLADVRERLRQNRNSAPLFDSARFTRHIESAFELAWERHLTGLEPDHIAVPALPASWLTAS